MEKGKACDVYFVSRESDLGDVYGLAHWDVSEHIQIRT